MVYRSREKMPHDSQLEYPLFLTISQNGACAKWSNIVIFKYRHIIYHFLAFYILNNFLYYTKFWKCKNNMLFNKEWPILGVFSKKKNFKGVIFHIYQEQNDANCLRISFLFYNLKIRKAVKYVSVLIVVTFYFFVFFLFDIDALRNEKIRNYKHRFC